jgi:GSCFA family
MMVSIKGYAMSSPYDALPPQAFWRSAVVETAPKTLQDLYMPKFPIHATDAIATAGSCFAQHIGRVLRQTGMTVVDAEPAPAGMPDDVARRFGYGLFSARYGNIYTTRQFVQLLQDVHDMRLRPEAVWEKDGRYYDALRPAVEPLGLDTIAELQALRRNHLAGVHAAIRTCDVFVFTAGLTETWADRITGTVFPVAPGVMAGAFDAERHALLRLDYADVLGDLQEARHLLQAISPQVRMLLTVSPVPLTATATGGHVLAATTRSKAVLRAALGTFADLHADVDYVPSYEIITNPAARGQFFAPNLRSVTAEGVAAVMAVFLAAHGLAPSRGATAVQGPQTDAQDDVACEEALLEAFGR